MRFWVYEIACGATLMRYAGSSRHPHWRIGQHFELLRLGRHQVPLMQQDFNRYPDQFSFKVLEVHSTKPEARAEEQALFDTIVPSKRYNRNRPVAARPSKGMKHTKQEAAAFVSKRLAELDSLAEARGSTLDAAAQDAGIHPSTLWRWRNGMQEPTLFTFEKLAMAVRET